MSTNESILKFLQDYPIFLEILKYLACAYIPLLCSAYKFGKYRGGIINKVELRQAIYAVNEHKKHYDEERLRNERLETEINKLKEIAHFRHWSYHPNDKPPRAPICLKCSGRMKIEDVIGETIDGNGTKNYVPALHISCPTCNNEPQIIYGLEMDELRSALGWRSEELKLPISHSK